MSKAGPVLSQRTPPGDILRRAVPHVRTDSGTKNGKSMILRRCQPSEGRELREWVKQFHYLQSAPPGFVVALEFLEGKGRIGAMLLGRPVARMYGEEIFELTRRYFIDSAPKNTESAALAMMRAFVRKWFPSIRLILSYSDPSQGHTGAIYKADGWARFGKTEARHGQNGWASRAGRKTLETYCSKVRWVRTP